jgi:hypothetical protein
LNVAKGNIEWAIDVHTYPNTSRCPYLSKHFKKIIAGAWPIALKARKWIKDAHGTVLALSSLDNARTIVRSFSRAELIKPEWNFNPRRREQCCGRF